MSARDSPETATTRHVPAGLLSGQRSSGRHPDDQRRSPSCERQELLGEQRPHGAAQVDPAQGDVAGDPTSPSPPVREFTHAEDLEQDLLGWSLIVHGKGSNLRTVQLSPPLALALRALPRGCAFPGDDDGYLSPRWGGKPMTNLIPKGHTMHSLRHRFATRTHALEHDVFAVQELLGHASPATTQG